MLSLLALAFLCMVTSFNTSDKSFLTGETTIKVPFADAQMSFLGFNFVAPLLLIVVTMYLHIFYGYWLELERERRQINERLTATEEIPIESIPTIFYFTDLFSRLLTGFVFYWLVPVVLIVMTRKAAANASVGLFLTYVTAIVTFALVLLRIRRSPGPRRDWGTILRVFILLVIICVVAKAILSPESFQRQLDLFQVDLSKAYLRNKDLIRANLEGASLAEANLQSAWLLSANLRHTDLRSANLRSAHLGGADLTQAELDKSDLRGAGMGRVIMQRTSLQDVNFQAAYLQEAFLRGSDLRGANLQEVNLRGVNLQEVNLRGVNLQGADL
jgi:hypothetical protein